MLIASAPLRVFAAAAPPGSTGTRGSPAELFLMIGLLVLSVVIGTVIVLAIRRRWMAKDKEESSPAGLMESMRTMLREGRLSQSEFDAAKARLSERIRSQPRKGEAGGEAGGAYRGVARTGSSALDAAIESARRREGHNRSRGQSPPET